LVSIGWKPVLSYSIHATPAWRLRSKRWAIACWSATRSWRTAAEGSPERSRSCSSPQCSGDVRVGDHDDDADQDHHEPDHEHRILRDGDRGAWFLHDVF